MDYTDFEAGRLRKGKSLSKEQADLWTQGEAGYWWQESNPDTRADRVYSAYKILREMNQERSQSNLRNARLYGNFEILGFNLRDYTRVSTIPANRITLNVIMSCVDTLTAKVAKTKPRPLFAGNNANYKQKKQIKLLDKFCRGLFYEGGIYREAPRVFVDGCTFDIGALKVYIDRQTKKVCFERVFPEELFVDDVDGMYMCPRQLIQRRIVPKEVLRQEFGDSKELQAAISALKQPPEAYVHGFGDVAEVIEAWHLPSAPGAGDGIHVYSIQGKELFSEPWKHDYFPFAFFRYSTRMLGFWGQSLTERLAGIQIEINRLLRSISEQLRRKGRGRIFVQIGSKVLPSHLTNGVADVVFYNGAPPTVDNANAVAAEEFAQLDRLYQRAFQEAGISELSAQAKKPSGLDAAVALREFQDIESDRFVMVGKAWEDLFLDAAEIAIDLVRTSGMENYRTMYADGRRGTVSVDWKEIQLARDEYKMEMFPVSALPSTPAYRMQRITEMKAEGYIDQATAERLLDFPDIDAENNLLMAAVDDVDQLISNILDEDKPTFVQPDEFTSIPLLLQRASAAYLRAKHQEGVTQERLAMLVQLIDAAKELVPPAPAATLPGPGPAGPGAPPPGAGPALGPQVGGSINVNAAPPVAPVAPPVVA